MLQMNLYYIVIVFKLILVFKSGVVVVEISNGSGASKSDLKSGDVITKLNGEKVENTAYLRYELYKNKPGDTIDITYIRDGKEHSIKVTLTKSKD